MTSMQQQASRDIVLVVDDSAQTVSMLADVLESAGATALVALRGDRALSIARQITPDIILLDAMMPGMDGFETCRHLKKDEALAHVPVIFMTGLTDTDHVLGGFEAGGVDYITKPIEPKELLARIRVHLANARIAHGAQAALDTTGRYLLATDEEGCLRWWTPQAGRLIAALLGRPAMVGTALPKAVRDTVARAATGESPPPVLLAIAEATTAVQITFVGRLGAGEFLMRVVEEVTGDIETTLRDRLQISDREAQVLSWIARGKSNRDIAEILDLSPRTINKHLERIFRKIGVENRTSAAVMVLKLLA
jgi:DNA-binding NarL/FixJ family response regulator